MRSPFRFDLHHKGIHFEAGGINTRLWRVGILQVTAKHISDRPDIFRIAKSGVSYLQAQRYNGIVLKHITGQCIIIFVLIVYCRHGFRNMPNHSLKLYISAPYQQNPEI